MGVVRAGVVFDVAVAVARRADHARVVYCERRETRESVSARTHSRGGGEGAGDTATGCVY